MKLKLGQETPKTIRLGTLEVKKLFLGRMLIYAEAQ
jgi:hypothetical protein